MDAFDFDTILFPFNWTCWHKGKFGPAVLARASEKEMGILALKTLAKRRWKEGEARKWSKTWYSPVETYEEASLAVRFTGIVMRSWRLRKSGRRTEKTDSDPKLKTKRVESNRGRMPCGSRRGRNRDLPKEERIAAPW